MAAGTVAAIAISASTPARRWNLVFIIFPVIRIAPAAARMFRPPALIYHGPHACSTTDGLPVWPPAGRSAFGCCAGAADAGGGVGPEARARRRRVAGRLCRICLRLERRSARGADFRMARFPPLPRRAERVARGLFPLRRRAGVLGQ